MLFKSTVTSHGNTVMNDIRVTFANLSKMIEEEGYVEMYTHGLDDTMVDLLESAGIIRFGSFVDRVGKRRELVLAQDQDLTELPFYRNYKSAKPVAYQDGRRVG